MAEQGPDWSKFNGTNPAWGLTTDSFAIAQVGGTYGGRLNLQAPYAAQIRNIRSRGRHAHAYIWFQVGGSQQYAKAALDYLLPRAGLPKGAIVALDYEAGASSSKQANTAAIMYGMQRIKDYGYTPMYYSYKPYTLAHVDSAQIVKRFGTCLWIAAYPYSYAVTEPDMNYFPSMDGVAIWQFTDKYAHSGGLDGNIDLTGITKSGYTASPAVTTVKKVSDNLPEKKYWPANVRGIGYARSNATTYSDNGLTKPKSKLAKDLPYKIFEIKGAAADVGKAWVSVAELAAILNPLADGVQWAVHAAKDFKLTNGETRKAGNYHAFGIKGSEIDLGGGQYAPASALTILL